MLVRRKAKRGEERDGGIEIHPQIGDPLTDESGALSTAAAIVEFAEPAFQPGCLVRGNDSADIDKAVDEDGDILASPRLKRNKHDCAEQPGCAHPHKAHASRMSVFRPLV